MSPRKLLVVATLLLNLMLPVPRTAPAAILQKGNQIVNLIAPVTNTGDITFGDLSIRNPDGSSTPWVLPPDTVLVINKIMWNFTASEEVTGLVQFNLGDYYRMRAQVTNNLCSGSDSVMPGVAVTNLDARIFLERVGDPERHPIPGTLSMRLVGYTAPDD